VQPDLDRFAALVRRELDAHDVSILEPASAQDAVDESRELRCPTPDGRIIVARWQEPIVDREAKQRRLEILASTIDAIADERAPTPSSRPPPYQSLRDELESLCGRAVAINALVIDANSPILWGHARGRDIVPEAWSASPAPADAPPPSGDDARLAEVSRLALEAVRGLSEVPAIRKGKRLRHVEREGPAPFLAHSCAGIYILTLVFAGAFDELRAERAVLESLSRIERLVLALPPLNPEPPHKGAGVIAMRRPRRR
jgi:hypothetical protein